MRENISEAIQDASDPVITLPCPNTPHSPGSLGASAPGQLSREVSNANRGVSVFPSGHPHFSRTSGTLAEARSPEKVSGADTKRSRDVESNGG